MTENDIVAIWTEGGRKIGLGHLRRCLIIARQLRVIGARVLFLVNNDPVAIKWITKDGFRFKNAGRNKEPCRNIACDRIKAVLLDTKKPVARLIDYFKKNACKVIVMDNLTPARLRADILIFPSVVFEKNMCQRGFAGKVFSGAGFIPLADSYVNARAKASRLKLRPPFQVLVTMGGSDPHQLTYKVASALLPIKEFLRVKLVIGPAFSVDRRLVKLEKARPSNIEFIRGSDDLSAIMAESHVAITALGTTLHELASVGVPAVIIANFKSDKKDMAIYRNLKINMPLGYYKDLTAQDIRNAVRALVSVPQRWGKLRQRSRNIVNGNGAGRIAAIIRGTFHN